MKRYLDVLEIREAERKTQILKTILFCAKSLGAG